MQDGNDRDDARSHRMEKYRLDDKALCQSTGKLELDIDIAHLLKS
jgi:hypothetical protein